MSFDPVVYLSKTDAMRLMQLHVSHGYFYWRRGEVEASKAMAFAKKMDALYQVGVNRNRRASAREHGRANTVLFMYPQRESTKLSWWLLATPGEGDVHHRENLLDARQTGQRLAWLPGYELAPMTKSGRPKPSWSWRMTSKELADWHRRLHQAARTENPLLMQQAIWSMFRVPGFASARSQVGDLLAEAQREWRIAGRSTPFPACPSQLYYVRHRKAERHSLSSLIRRANRGAVAWFGQSARHMELRSPN